MSWVSDRPLFFSHVVLTKNLGVCRARNIRERIKRRMDLWERGIYAGLDGDTEAESADWEGRAASRGEQEDEKIMEITHYSDVG